MSRGAGGLASYIVAVAVGCGGSTAATKPPAAAGEASSDCEPGRCLTDISAVVDEHRPAARACFEAGHERDPSLEGRIVVNFEIDPSGAVVDASQSGQARQILDEQVVACVVDVLKHIQFARSEHGKSTKAFHVYEFNAPGPRRP
jgi:hypothetical protein